MKSLNDYLIWLINRELCKNNIYNQAEFSPEINSIKEKFKRHQDILLMIFNSEEGRDLFGIKHNQLIVKVDPNGWHYLEGFDGKNLWIHFKAYLGWEVSNQIGVILDQLEIAAESGYVHRGNRFDAARFYAGFEKKDNFPQIFCKSFPTSGGDGHTAITGNGSWSGAHDGGSGNPAYTNTAPTASTCLSQPQADGGWRIDRVLIPADTSGVPDNANIKSASFNGYVTYYTNGSGDASVGITPSTQTNPNGPVVDADHGANSSGTNLITQVPFGSLVTSTLNKFNLNATGISGISLTGYTKNGYRESHDINNSPMSNTGGYTDDTGLSLSGNATPAQRPFYDIIYPVGGAFFKKMLS
jgi:hypothetical protein